MEEALIIKFLRGECSPSEERDVHRWLENPEAQVHLEKVIEKYWMNPTPPLVDKTDYAQLLSKIHGRMRTASPKVRPSFQTVARKSLRVAATILLAVFAGYFLLLSWKTGNESASSSSVAAVKKIERVTGIGEKLTLTLPDGTKIVVNTESMIQFDTNYGRDERLIRLEGEAYFEVAPDSLRPFKVLTNGFTTEALGTAFNISTKNTGYRVALTEGKVKVGSGIKEIHLKPGQMAIWKTDQKDVGFRVARFSASEVISWKDGWLNVDRKPLGNVLKDLERWYGVDITIDPKLDLSQRISGTFENKNLKNILTGLSFSAAFTFELTGNQVTIKK